MTPAERFDVVAAAAHPDDLEITCCGTLALLVRQGYRVAILDLTTGEPTPRGSEETRAREADAAARTLGVPFRRMIGLPNRVLMDCPENRFVLATWLRRLRPTILLGLAGRTPAASPDHYQAQLLVEASRFYSQLTRWDDRFEGTAPHRIPHLVYGIFPIDAETRVYPGSFVIDISSTFEVKLAAISCYESQFDTARFEKLRHFVTGHNVAVGGRCGFAYGEQFALPVPVAASDLAALVLGGKGSFAPVVLPPPPEGPSAPPPPPAE
jgi:N-acetylglucosamine malate deacetylase 1